MSEFYWTMVYISYGFFVGKAHTSVKSGTWKEALVFTVVAFILAILWPIIFIGYLLLTNLSQRLNMQIKSKKERDYE